MPLQYGVNIFVNYSDNYRTKLLFIKPLLPFILCNIIISPRMTYNLHELLEKTSTDVPKINFYALINSRVNTGKGRLQIWHMVHYSEVGLNVKTGLNSQKMNKSTRQLATLEFLKILSIYVNTNNNCKHKIIINVSNYYNLSKYYYNYIQNYCQVLLKIDLAQNILQ